MKRSEAMKGTKVAVGRVFFLFTIVSALVYGGMICAGYAKNGRDILAKKNLDTKSIAPDAISVEDVHQCPKLKMDDGVFQAIKRRMMEERENFIRKHKRVYVQHQFKCGGTTLCRFFHETNLSTPETHNCNGEKDLRNLTNRSVEELEHFLSNKPYQVVFNEKRLFETDLPVNNFIFVTTSREPVSRVVSTMLQVWRDLEIDENGIVKNLAQHVESFIEHGTYNGQASIMPRNFQVLYLAGAKRNTAEEWATLYDQALYNLQQFTFTIPTDELNEGLDSLGAFFGQQVRSRMGSTQQNFRDAASQVLHLQTRHPELVHRIEMENRYDRCLYNQVVALWMAQKQVLDEILGEHGRHMQEVLL